MCPQSGGPLAVARAGLAAANFLNNRIEFLLPAETSEFFRRAKIPACSIQWRYGFYRQQEFVVQISI
jgi:hypothetical protein